MNIFFDINFLKGLILCAVIAIIAMTMQSVFQDFFLENIFDQLIIAMIIGLLIKQFFPLHSLASGVNFCSKYILELGIVLLGFNMDFTYLTSNSIIVFMLILVATLCSLIFIIIFANKILKLSSNLAVLLATGNSICGNSAIVAIAPIIKATPSEIGIAIGFSAICGAVQVVLLPLVFPMTSLSLYQYGLIVGISVYAVPQVIAASFAISNISGIIATQVKLIRILFLGPLILLISFIKRRQAACMPTSQFNPSLFVPWFIIGFITTVLLANTIDLPIVFLEYTQNISSLLFVMALAAIGFKIELNEIKQTAWQVITTVLFANMLLLIIAVLGINLLHLD